MKNIARYENLQCDASSFECGRRGSPRKLRRPGEPSTPLYLTLFPPKVSDIPAGATLGADGMCLEIATPPVFGEAKNERRFFVFPVYLPLQMRVPTPENTLLAFNMLHATSPAVQRAVSELAALARTPAARAFAKAYPAEQQHSRGQVVES